MLSALRKHFPDLQRQGDLAHLSLTPEIKVCLSKAGEIEVWDEKGGDYSSELKEAQEEVSRMPLSEVPIPILVLQTLRENLTGSMPGFDETVDLVELPPYDHTRDPLLEQLRKEVKLDRVLLIQTYGTRFLLEDPPGTQASFNAAELRGPRNKATVKMRGMDPRLQQTVRCIPEFTPFVKRLVRQVEKEDLTQIAVACRGGHHRSVTVGEWLTYLYPEASVEHLTIDL